MLRRKVVRQRFRTEFGQGRHGFGILVRQDDVREFPRIREPCDGAPEHKIRPVVGPGFRQCLSRPQTPRTAHSEVRQEVPRRAVRFLKMPNKIFGTPRERYQPSAFRVRHIGHRMPQFDTIKTNFREHFSFECRRKRPPRHFHLRQFRHCVFPHAKLRQSAYYAHQFAELKKTTCGAKQKQYR